MILHLCSLLGADFAAAAVLITFGALIGKVSPLQLMLIAFIEIVFFVLNERLGVGMLQVGTRDSILCQMISWWTKNRSRSINIS